MKLLKPILESKEDYEELEEIILNYYKDLIYIPLLKIFSDSEKVENAKLSYLEQAIRKGTVRFWRGEFTGKFSARISSDIRKLGGKWNAKNKSFTILLSRLPKNIQDRIRVSENQFNKKNKMAIDFLDSISGEKITDINKISDFFDTKIFKLDENIKESLGDFGVVPKVTKNERRAIAYEYTDNLSIYINNFTQEETDKLRSKMKKNVLSGTRYEDVIDSIQSSYGVTRSKAKFLARQETALMMSALQTQRYKDAGVDGYIWRCVVGTKDHPVRPMHKTLDGVFIKWDDPPIINKNGDRKHAGEDFNCRCFKQPVVRF